MTYNVFIGTLNPTQSVFDCRLTSLVSPYSAGLFNNCCVDSVWSLLNS